MKRKIHPKDQTQALNIAKMEFVKRNKKESEEFNDLIAKDKKARDLFLTKLSDRLGDRSKAYKDSWDLLLRGQIFDKELKDKIDKFIIPPAINSIFPFFNYIIEYGQKSIRKEHKSLSELSAEEREERYFEYLCHNANQIFYDLTKKEPSAYLLCSIDLRRSNDVIIEELKSHITENKLKFTNKTDKRFKWLACLEEILEVWDLYEKAGKQPSQITFRQIGKKVKRPLSTVKNQWRAAYEKIYHTPYTPELKYTNEEKKADADKLLCAKCPHLKNRKLPCYKGGDFYPCAEYLKVAGKERKMKSIEFKDEINYDEYMTKQHKKGNTID